MVFDAEEVAALRLLLGCLMLLRSGLMVVLLWIRPLVFLLLELGCLLTSRSTAGAAADGAMLIMFSFDRVVQYCGGIVSVLEPFADFSGLSCGLCF